MEAGMAAFDLTVITARDREQQWLFEQRLAALPWSAWTHDLMVVPDPPGPPPGSGGSTIFALCAALDRLGLSLDGGEGELERALAGRKVLVLHSGGPTLAEPLIASLGRAFAPASGDAAPLSTFEAVAESLGRLTSTSLGGVTLACGDVLYRASSPVTFPEADALVWACPALLPQASRHGVLLWESETGFARRALQKPDVSTLQALGFEEEAPLDTGVLHLAPRVVAALVVPFGSGKTAASAALAQRGVWQGLDLYRDLLPAMCSEREGPGAASPVIERLARFRLRVLCPEDGRFTHFGTSDEVLKLRRQDMPLAERGVSRSGDEPPPLLPAGDGEARARAEEICARLRADEDLAAASFCGDATVAERAAISVALQQIARRVEVQGDASPLLAARLWRACAGLEGETAPEQPLHGRAFAAIRRVLTPETPADVPAGWRYPVGARVTAEAPVRIDLAGGWTDTPPQAFEMGGRVLNVALTLDGRLPVRAAARILPEPVIHFSAVDLGVELQIASRAELGRWDDPSDPFALHKAALVECGLLATGCSDLREVLARWGGGLHLETEARVPKGSGLGTSSILGATVMGCLRELTGGDTSWQALFRDVLAVEQRITSGGGWQDQVGGLLPGIKLTETAAGFAQKPEVRQIECEPEILAEFERRLVLFYTGVPRLARNVLQRVVSRYLAREPGMRASLRRMSELAGETAEALQHGDFPAVGTALCESWELNQFLEPTASNAGVEAIIALVAGYCDGWKLAGAGGGGFLILLASSREAAEQVRAVLEAQPQGQLFKASVSRTGLLLQTPTLNL